MGNPSFSANHKGTFLNDHRHSGSLGTQRPKFDRARLTIGPFRTLSTLQYLRILVKIVKAHTMPLSTTQSVHDANNNQKPVERINGDI